MKLLPFLYKDRSFERRAEITVDQIKALDLIEIAEYIVQLEMKLEELGNEDHYKAPVDVCQCDKKIIMLNEDGNENCVQCGGKLPLVITMDLQ